MSTLEWVCQSLGVHPEACKEWDPPTEVVTFDVGDPPPFPVHQVLAQHRVSTGSVGIITYWGQYLRPEPNAFPDDWLFPFAPDAGVWWDLLIDGEPLRDHNNIRMLKNPFSGMGPAYAPTVYYPTDRDGANRLVELRFNVAAVLPFDRFHVAGRLRGFDIPADYWNRKLLPELRRKQSARAADAAVGR